MKIYDLRETCAWMSTIVPETQSRKTSVSESESFDKTIDTDHLKSQMTGRQNVQGLVRPCRQSLSDITQQLTETPFIAKQELPPLFSDELVLPVEATSAPDELESDQTDRQRTALDPSRVAVQLPEVQEHTVGRNNAQLTAKQQVAIRAEESNLNGDQQNHSKKRKQLRGTAQPSVWITSASENDDPGANLQKGKDVHPRNWGVLSKGLEMDVELQHALMSAYEKQERAQKKKKCTRD